MSLCQPLSAENGFKKAIKRKDYIPDNSTEAEHDAEGMHISAFRAGTPVERVVTLGNLGFTAAIPFQLMTVFVDCPALFAAVTEPYRVSSIGKVNIQISIVGICYDKEIDLLARLVRGRVNNKILVILCTDGRII